LRIVAFMHKCRGRDRPAWMAALGQGIVFARGFETESMVGTVIRILLICLLVGLVMAFFGLTPEHIIDDTIATARHAWALVVNFVLWAVPYVLLGGSVVLPVVAIVFILRFVRR
jgi:Na+/H+-dicarboxylate symporter